MDKDLEVTEQWVQGCFHGNHCGAGCGDGQKYGGGKVKDSLDQCCRNHDLCWARFGANSPCCDKALINCVPSGYPNQKKVINQIFGSNAKKCK